MEALAVKALSPGRGVTMLTLEIPCPLGGAVAPQGHLSGIPGDTGPQPDSAVKHLYSGGPCRRGGFEKKEGQFNYSIERRLRLHL